MPSRLLGSGTAVVDRPLTSGATVSRRKTGTPSTLHTQANSAGVRRVTLGVCPDLPGASMAWAGGSGAGLATSGGVQMVLLGVFWKTTLLFTQSISGLCWVSQQCPSTIAQLGSKGVM